MRSFYYIKLLYFSAFDAVNAKTWLEGYRNFQEELTNLYMLYIIYHK